MAVELRSRCLFCDRPRRASTGKKEKSVAKEISQSDIFWICDVCQAAKPEHAKALELKLLAQNDLPKELLSMAFSHQKFHSHDLVSELGVVNSCNCQSCNERLKLENDQLLEYQNLQSYWIQLRHAVRQMYRDRLFKDGVTGRGRKFDLTKLKELVARQCQHNPHQLYQRLEIQAREYIMDIKVQLLQILVSPEKLGLANDCDKDSSSPINSNVANFFLHSVLSYASQLLETVANMRCFLERFEKDYLEKFGVSWQTVNCYLFHTVVNLDPLLQSNLPLVYSQLGVSWNPSSLGFRLDNLPSEVADTLKKFLELNECLTSSQTKMLKAQEKMDKCLAEEMQVPGEQAEFSSFSNSLRCLLLGNRRAAEHSASTSIDCTRCKQRHCGCDECTISHLITCGLISEEDTIDLSDNLQSFDGMETSSNSSEYESDESDYGSVDSAATEEKLDSMDIICKQRTSIICSDGQKFTKVETILLPSNLYSLHNSSDSPKDTVCDIFGQWEGSPDEASLLHSCGHVNHSDDRADFHNTKSASRKASKEGNENQLRTTLPQSDKKKSVDESSPSPHLMNTVHPPSHPPPKPKNQQPCRGCAGGGKPLAKKNRKQCDSSIDSDVSVTTANNRTQDMLSNYSTKSQESVGTQVEGSEDTEDSSSINSSEPPRDGKQHCDCCYCEMFGYGNGEFPRHFGRDDYPQIRERLRSKLKRKDEQQAPAQKSEQIEGYRGYESLDKLLEYINGPQDVRASTTSAVAKTKKKPRQPKQKKASKSNGSGSDTRNKQKSSSATSQESGRLSDDASIHK
ncbi:unnamed protein product, partial [Soboliphyme baturini]|uniref:FAM193_C domain-containing protein n=1 Tax=Soboliphyme baturini TaxID=241478 RepID=A0A183IDN7_9BILA